LKDRNAANPALRITAIVLLSGLGYAVLRFHIAGSVPWKEFPFFILNKGLSLSAFILLTLSFSIDPLKSLGFKVPGDWLDSRKALGMTGFLLILVHAVMSFLMFTPAQYGKFFEPDGTLTLLSGLSMLGGVLALVVLWAYNLSFQTFLREDRAYIRYITSRKFMMFAMLLGAAHLFFMGYQSWFTQAGWHSGLPPISLLAFILFVASYVLNALAGSTNRLTH
jgi:DMSO/TMAO reductase YedYZ heme-binding membrane subunit